MEKLLNQVNIAQDRNLTKPTAENPDNWEYLVVVVVVPAFALILTLLLITLKTYRLHGLTILADQKILESMKILQFKLVAHCTHVLQLILLLRLMVIAVKHFGNIIKSKNS